MPTPTPILDFVDAYLARSPRRLHMPGHKGVGPLGCEARDITEIDGACGLYADAGPVAESEAIASRLFGMPTFYSAEGSSLAIRAMLRLALTACDTRPPCRGAAAAHAQKPSPSGGPNARESVQWTDSSEDGSADPWNGGPASAGSDEVALPPSPRPLILAGRNAHAAFLSAAALLDLDIEWLTAGSDYHSCPVTAADVAAALERLSPRCRIVYLTSPDYLGHTLDISPIADACHRRGALLLVDNAHGAYLKFLSPSRHPIDLGADLCCDSAHKTLPALTGAAYLHIHPRLAIDPRQVKDALALFGSTSPSWLVLQSLDACNPCIEALPGRLSAFLPKLDALKRALADHGFPLVGDEPMKLTLAPRPFGYTGDELAAILTEKDIACELHDPDFLVLMPTPENSDADLDALRKALLAVPRRDPLPDDAPPPCLPPRAMTVREAALSPRQILPLEQCEGRVLAAPALSCPPCVPVATCGEVLDAPTLARLRYYGIDVCEVVGEGLGSRE